MFLFSIIIIIAQGIMYHSTAFNWCSVTRARPSSDIKTEISGSGITPFLSFLEILAPPPKHLMMNHRKHPMVFFQGLQFKLFDVSGNKVFTAGAHFSGYLDKPWWYDNDLTSQIHHLELINLFEKPEWSLKPKLPIRLRRKFHHDPKTDNIYKAFFIKETSKV